MTAQALGVTGAALIAAVVLLVLALRRPIRPPQHRVLWIIAMLLIAASIAFRLVLLVGVTMNGSAMDVATIATGSLAVVLVFIAAFRQPAWSGWVLIVTAVAVPLLTWVVSVIVGDASPVDVAGPMLVFYSIPAAITGLLLVLSARVAAERRATVA